MINSGEINGNLDQVSGLIKAGLKRLDQFRHESGFYSLWGGGNPVDYITVKIAHRLLPFLEIEFADVHQRLEKTKHALLEKEIKENQLLVLDPRFKDKMNSVKDAAVLYFAGNGEQQAALKFLRKAAIRDGNQVHWDGSPSIGYWGGTLEATCDAARVMHAAGDPLFDAAFQYIGSRMVNGRLYSTADTRALIELIDSMRSSQSQPIVEIDGDLQQLDRDIVCQSISVRQGHLLARIDEEIEVDHLTPKSNYKFNVSVSSKQVKIGKEVNIQIQLNEETLCPVARVFLPGSLAFLKGGANAQTAYQPVNEPVRRRRWSNITAQLTLDAVAVRRGSGYIYIMVHDLYDAEKVGTIKPIYINVTQ
ncbi:MAG: hypothetical protein AAF633_06505 [Chloroflexota bacterium]